MDTQATQVSPSSPSHSAIQALQSTLDSLYRVSIPDGRTFVGYFTALDPQGNLILDQTIEIDPNGTRRDVGLVLVLKKHWVKVEREVHPELDREMLATLQRERGEDQNNCMPI